MANTKSGCGKGCLITFVIVIVVIVAAVGIGSAVLLNSTANKLKFGDFELYEGMTLNDLGLGDVKIKEIAKMLGALSSPNESQIVTNKFDPVADKNASETILAESNLPKKANGENDYVSLVSNPVIYNKEYVKNYTDKNIAFILNSIITDAGEDVFNTYENLDFIEVLNANFEEISITKQNDVYYMRVVVSADAKSFIDEIKRSLPNFLHRYLPDRIYLVSTNRLSADENGILTTVSSSLQVNNYENEVLIDAILNAVVKHVSDASGAGAIADDEKGFINDAIGAAVSELISNLGYVGSGEADADGVLTGGKVLGVSGISAGGLTLITRTEA